MTTYARDWHPRNLDGSIYDDPRDELTYWARTGRRLNLEVMAVPVATLAAAAELRVCRSSVISRGDEDGPMTPMRLWCKRPEGHRHMHGNGYTNWHEQDAEKLPEAR